MAHRVITLTSLLAFAAIVMVTAQQTGQQGAAGRGGQPTGAAAPARGGGQGGRGRGGAITIHAAHVLDGKGGAIQNGVVTVQGARITSVAEAKPGETYTYDLGDATVLPGMIDVHVHLNWYFGPNGNYGERNVPAGYEGQAVQENARKTLMAGFTTVQSVGWAKDKQLRDAIAAGLIVGPRLLSSLDQIIPGNMTAAQLIARVIRDRDNGADLIKLFASGSIRDGGKMNVTKEQVEAVCGAAKAVGLRTLVHAHDPESIITAVNAGCTEIEHGLFANDEAIAVMKKANVYYDPNIGLVLQNYIENKDHYLPSGGNFTEDGFAFMEKAVPSLAPLFRKALAAGLRMPMGTDAVAGAHGQNAREVVARVAAGQKPMDAIIGTTSLSAESLGLGGPCEPIANAGGGRGAGGPGGGFGGQNEGCVAIGTLAAGYQADIVAAPGDAIANIATLKNVSFVMKGGQVYKK